jgi:16S rRNA (adenine1518-N6/adenine1519-N6)-dimethyltransferase
LRRRALGQHRLVDRSLLELIVNSLNPTPGDVVLEVGAGDGNLTELLARRARLVVAYELDPELYQMAAARLKKYSNVRLVLGDGFKHEGSFDLFASNLPYSESSRFLEWVVTRDFKRAVVMLQREFADKLMASPGQRHYRAPSAMAQYRFIMKPLAQVGRDAFTPRPRVGSTLLQLIPRPNTSELKPETIRAVKRLFSFRRKLVATALRHLARQCGITEATLCSDFEPVLGSRVKELDPSTLIALANRLAEVKPPRTS